ncbi:C-type lectin BpLec-like [Sitophilus oryzae]|uniref:C-type lectin BpLec-like n=1 Tax=Sitophilus oryzae TaxID=7048 RepID=A0A6J2XKH6_SITOR|nr:C-type lectin BpLec-like [Sitophilus oryzae]
MCKTAHCFNKMFFKCIVFLSILCGLFASDCILPSSKTYFASTEALNWTDAREACINVGGELASIITNEEYNSIETFLVQNNKKPANKWSGYWLAGIRHSDGTFYWDTTGTRVGTSVGGWLFNEPNDVSQMEHCIELKWDDEMGYSGWNDISCDTKRRYLCQNTKKEDSRVKSLEDYSFLGQANPKNKVENYRLSFYHLRFPRRRY